MSFIYSQALVAEFLEDNCSDIDVSAQSSESLTPKLCWWHDKTMEPSRHSRFGMTYAPLTERLGMALSTWFVGVFLARTYQSPETVLDWTAKGQGYGQKWLGLLAKYSPDTHSLKTAQLSLLEDSTGCCVTLPRWGLMLDGELFPQPMLEPFTAESESGSWATPTTMDRLPPKSEEALLREATITRPGRSKPANLRDQVSNMRMWPTPTICGNYNRKGASATSGDGLATAVKMWPTATATAYKGWSPNHNRANTDDRLDYSVERESFQPGQQTPPMRLNPDWVEWLMGWPIWQTALKPLETGKLAEWRQQHSPSFSETVQHERA